MKTFIYVTILFICDMKILGIDFDRVTVANAGALVLILAYVFFIYFGVDIPTEFNDVIKTVVTYLFLSKAYEYGKVSGPQPPTQ